MHDVTRLLLACLLASAFLTASTQASDTALDKPSDKPRDTASDAIVWSIPLASGDAAPVVSRDRVFVADAAFTDNGEEAYRFQCFAAASGKGVWQQSLVEKSYTSQDISDRFPVRPIANPILAGDKLITLSYGGIVSCLKAADGTLVWQRDLVEHHQATPLQFGWCTTPWSDGKIVVLACGGPVGLLIALDVASGELVWSAGPGLQAAYGSIVELTVEDGDKQLCYLGQNELVGVDKSSGELLWSYSLNKPGMTNTVTPIAISDSRLLVSGQGLSSTQLLSVRKNDGKWQVESQWQSTKLIPFYCNWIVDKKSQTVFGFSSGRVSALSTVDGKSQWMQRGWTDANFVKLGDKILALRGDGFMGLCDLDSQGLRLTHGARVVNDRVWTAPIVVEDKAYIRGRNSLTLVDLSALPELTEIPAGTEVDSMTAMYGKQHEKVVELVELAKSQPLELHYEQYDAIVQDRSIRFGDREYQQLLAASDKLPIELQLKFAQDWVRRWPESITAFDRLTEILEKSGQNQQADKLKHDRFVDVQVQVRVAEGVERVDSIYLSGNAASVGGWKVDGIKLSRTADNIYRGTIAIPAGDFEFKLTRGLEKSEEVRTDGRAISNRRRRVLKPTTISATVQGWKSVAADDQN